ncbi:hypothetical protein ACI2KR_30440 [Pseudomonas luteola]
MSRAVNYFSKLCTNGANVVVDGQSFVASSSAAAIELASMLGNPYLKTSPDASVLSEEDKDLYEEIARFKGDGFLVDWSNHARKVHNPGQYTTCMVDLKHLKVEVLDSEGCVMWESPYYETFKDIEALEANIVMASL